MSQRGKSTIGAAASPRSEVAAALAACRSALLGVGLLSAVSSVLMLTGSMFMLEVYDRVLPSRSVPTLVGLAAIALLLYAFQGALDLLRGRILVRIGQAQDEALGRRVYDAIVRLPLKLQGGGQGLQPLRDLDQVRGFLASSGPVALFDLPWMPLCIGICFLFHPWIGVMALGGAVLLVAVTIAAEVLTRAPAKVAMALSAKRHGLVEAGRRNAEALQAMGMGGRMAQVWAAVNTDYLAANCRAADVAGGFGTLSKVLRMVLQSAVLGVGAYLVIHQEATAGIIIASSILTARALAPVEQVIAHWKGAIAAQEGWKRLRQLLLALPESGEPLALPRPAARLQVEGLSVTPPGSPRPVVQEVSFALERGQALGIIGPSASGKSSLVRALVGAWPPTRGRVRLDGASLDQWSPAALGRHVGYLPQDVELFDGTVAENIARFDEEASPDAIIAAAKAAGVHEMVLRLPEGYQTRVGEGGTAVSAGQRQRIGLARALFGEPFLVVLDEPNSNLDAEGEQALTQAILAVRQRGSILVVVAHRPSALAAVDRVLMLANGRVQSFGPKDEVLGKVLRGTAAKPLKVVNEGSVA